MTSLTVDYRTKVGSSRPTFAALNMSEFVDALRSKFPSWEVTHRAYIKNHLKAAQAFGSGNKHYITMRSADTLRLVNGESLRGEIRIIDQDYAGRALTVEYGMYRLVCSNGLFAFRSIATPIRITHHLNKTEMLMRLDSIIVASSEVFNRMVEQANELLTATITMPVTVLERVAMAVGISKRTLEQLKTMAYWKQNRPEDNINTVWGLYNMINEVDRQAARRNSVAYIERDTKLIDAIQQAIAA